MQVVAEWMERTLNSGNDDKGRRKLREVDLRWAAGRDGILNGTPRTSKLSYIALVTVSWLDLSFLGMGAKGTLNPRDGIANEYLFAHTLSTEQLAEFFSVDTAVGLNPEQVKQRTEEWGPNQLKQEEGVKLWKLLFHHTFNFMMGVLLVALSLTIATLQPIDSTVIAFIMLGDIIIGVVQEKSVEAMRSLSAPSATVLREGVEQEVCASELVPGDIVLLTQGDKVPADVRVYEAMNLECEEGVLTGESVPIEKKVDAIDNKDCPLGDRNNLAFMSTLITKGKGKGIVIMTGSRTELGQIAHAVANAKKQTTSLEKRMNRLGILLACAAVGCIGMVLLFLWVHDTEELYPTGLTVAVAIAVALLPEALVAVITVVLSLGVKGMAEQKALVRKMKSLEQLGNVTDVCSDKTGTLTQGKMMATELWLPEKSFIIDGEGFNPNSGNVFIKPKEEDGEEAEEEEEEEGASPTPVVASMTEIEDKDHHLHLALLVCSLCNTSDIKRNVKVVADKQVSSKRWWKPWTWCGKAAKQHDEKRGEGAEEWVALGSPTEAALVVLSAKLGYSRQLLKEEWQNLQEFPFDSTIKRMSVIHQRKEDKSVFLFTKGAPERLLPRCTAMMEDGGVTSEFGDEELERIKAMNEQLANQGLRVLALAYREMTDECEDHEDEEDPQLNREDVEQNLTFVGLVGLQDPPRKGVKEAVATCHKAGIIVRMLTGDHLSTALAIAKQIGIITEEEEGRGLAMTSTVFDRMTEEELDELPLVIARCSPESKVKMVKQLHHGGKVVAMTGDGVNDSPAISAADIGIAMGIAGTDVTKEASDIILLDDDFCTIARAIAEGRRTFANIRKFLVHLLSSNVAETIVMIIGIVSGLYPPMTSLQILWLNLVSSPPPALLLGVEPATPDLMDRKKRPIGEPTFTIGTIADIFIYGIIMGALSLTSFIVMNIVWDFTVKQSQVTTFISLTIMLLYHGYNCRRLKSSSFDHTFFIQCWPFHLTFILGSISVVLSVYIPGINNVIFRQEDPGWRGWALGAGSVVLFVILSEMYKVLRRLLHNLWIAQQDRKKKRKDTKARLRKSELRAKRATLAKKEEEEAMEMEIIGPAVALGGEQEEGYGDKDQKQEQDNAKETSATNEKESKSEKEGCI
ncbi:P-type ATPase [Balamuthia mandrillaris]